MHGMTTADPITPPVESSVPVLTEFGDRLLWIRVFELRIISRAKMAELLGEGYDDSTLGTWEEKQHRPRDKAAVAKRYREVALEHGKDISASWILYGSGLLVTLLTYGDTTDNVSYPDFVVIDQRQGRLDLEPFPPARTAAALTLV